MSPRSDQSIPLSAVFERDNYRCQNCGAIGGHNGDTGLHAHKMLTGSEKEKKVNTYVTLCSECHNTLFDRVLELASLPGTNGNAQKGESLKEMLRRCPNCGWINTLEFSSQEVECTKCSMRLTRTSRIWKKYKMVEGNSTLVGRNLYAKDWIELSEVMELSEVEKEVHEALKQNLDNKVLYRGYTLTLGEVLNCVPPGALSTPEGYMDVLESHEGRPITRNTLLDPSHSLWSSEITDTNPKDIARKIESALRDLKGKGLLKFEPMNENRGRVVVKDHEETSKPKEKLAAELSGSVHERKKRVILLGLLALSFPLLQFSLIRFIEGGNVLIPLLVLGVIVLVLFAYY